MCGIVGWIASERPVERQRFETATDALSHRGPEGRGTLYLDDDRVALGHRRLAIVDLSDAGRQPMSIDGLHLTFNGEIYNHPQLRRELEERGHRYTSHCDAESILHAYREWGRESLEHLRGIFSFALWDEAEQRLFAARDALGVKPFYYSLSAQGEDDQRLIFASQPRALLALGESADVDGNAFLDYLSYGIVPEARAIWTDMAKLPPAHTLEWQDGRLRVERYWQAAYRPTVVDADDAKKLLESALVDAVDRQLMSDVPVATYLSGGIDSSLLTAIATERLGRPMTAFTVGFDEPQSDERAFARVVARHCGSVHHEAVLRRRDAMAGVDELVDAYDEPFGMGAAFPMLLIARLTAEHGFKVVLSGDGADELFAGYHHYDQLSRRYRRRGMATASRVGSWPRYLATRVLGAFDPLEYYRPHEAIMDEALQGRLVPRALLATRREPWSWRWRRYFRDDLDAVTAARLLDLHTYLPDEILVKVDRATMFHGVEARVPFLDRQLVELALSLDRRLVYGGERKALLKAVAARWLPPRVLTARKKGFSIPVDRWLLEDGWHRDVIDELDGGRLQQLGLLRHDGLSAVLESVPVARLMQLFLAERWAQRWAS